MLQFMKQGEALIIDRIKPPVWRGGVLITHSAIIPGAGPGGKSSAAVRRRFQEALAEGGAQVGLRLARGQSVELSITGLRVTPSAAIARDLERAFASLPGEHWAGFSVGIVGPRGKPRRAASGGWTSIMRVKGFSRRTAQAFQLVPVALALGGQSFAKHCLLGVSMLYTQPRLIKTTVETRPAR